VRMEYCLVWKARLTCAHTLAERRASPGADTSAAAPYLGEHGAGRLEIPAPALRYPHSTLLPAGSSAKSTSKNFTASIGSRRFQSVRYPCAPPCRRTPHLPPAPSRPVMCPRPLAETTRPTPPIQSGVPQVVRHSFPGDSAAVANATTLLTPSGGKAIDAWSQAGRAIVLLDSRSPSPQTSSCRRTYYSRYPISVGSRPRSGFVQQADQAAYRDHAPGTRPPQVRGYSWPVSSRSSTR